MGYYYSAEWFKRLKNKNIRTFINKPLIEYTFINTENTLLDKIILTTDCNVSIDIAKKYKHIDIPFKRPSNLCEDNSTSLDAIKHCLSYYKEKKIELPDYILILQPTSPQRSKEDINFVINYLNKKNDNKSLTTVSKIKNIKNLLHNKKEISNIYYENGLIFALSIEDIYNNHDKKIKHISLPYDNVIQLEYPLDEKIIDIDTLEDFNYAEFLVKNKNKMNENKINKKEIIINNRVINSETKPFIILEIGINHNADINKAVKMIYDHGLVVANV